MLGSLLVICYDVTLFSWQQGRIFYGYVGLVKLSVQERGIAEITIEMFQENDPSGTTRFLTRKYIYGEHYDRLKAIWVAKNSLSADRQKAVVRIFKVFVSRGELTQQNKKAPLCNLTKDGYLYQELQRRNRTSG